MGGGASVSEFFFLKESKLGDWGGVLGRGRWMDRRTGPNQFAPSTSSKLEI